MGLRRQLWRQERKNIGSVSNNVSYTHNLDDSQATPSYPSGAVVTYTPASSGAKTAGRTGTVQDNANGINYVTGSSGPGSYATYAAPGMLASFTNGDAGAVASATASAKVQSQSRKC